MAEDVDEDYFSNDGDDDKDYDENYSHGDDELCTCEIGYFVAEILDSEHYPIRRRSLSDRASIRKFEFRDLHFSVYLEREFFFDDFALLFEAKLPQIQMPRFSWFGLKAYNEIISSAKLDGTWVSVQREIWEYKEKKKKLKIEEERQKLQARQSRFKGKKKTRSGKGNGASSALGSDLDGLLVPSQLSVDEASKDDKEQSLLTHNSKVDVKLPGQSRGIAAGVGKVNGKSDAKNDLDGLLVPSQLSVDEASKDDKEKSLLTQNSKVDVKLPGHFSKGCRRR